MKVDWIFIDDGNLSPWGHECLRCGAYHKLPENLPMDEFLKIAEAFINLHKLCKVDVETTR